MVSACVECSGATVWDDDAASNICMTCGTLVDPSQSILTSGLEYRTESTSTWDVPSSQATTLKSLRNSNWQLSGQGKEGKDRQNAVAMNQYITSLANALSVPGLSPRAFNLFTQAMTKGQFRWGRKANLVAGACLILALREAKKPDFRHDIASLLEQKPASLTRILSLVLSLLGMSLPPSDPSFYLPSLQIYLSAALREDSDEDSGLPSSLTTVLKSLPMNSVLTTAHALSDLLARSMTTNSKSTLQGSAVAIFILSMESQARTSFQGLAELAAFLAARCQVGKSVVMKRYKILQEELAAMMTQISWLDHYKKEANGRAKVAKRRLVARGLPDILAWGKDSWKAQYPHLSRPSLLLEYTSEDDSKGEPDLAVSEMGPTRIDVGINRPPPIKRPKLSHTLTEASQFLLNPLSSSIPSLSLRTSACPTSTSRTSFDSTHSTSMPLTSYILAASKEAIQQAEKPTRLQMLAASRPGLELDDEELFEEGELGGLMRSESEVQLMARVWAEEHPSEEERPPPQSKLKRKRRAKDEPKAPSRRLNRDALQRFMKDVDGGNENSAFTGLAVGFTDDYDEKDDSGEEEEESEFSKIRRAMEYGLFTMPGSPREESIDEVDFGGTIISDC